MPLTSHRCPIRGPPSHDPPRRPASTCPAGSLCALKMILCPPHSVGVVRLGPSSGGLRASCRAIAPVRQAIPVSREQRRLSYVGKAQKPGRDALQPGGQIRQPGVLHRHHILVACHEPHFRVQARELVDVTCSVVLLCPIGGRDLEDALEHAHHDLPVELRALSEAGDLTEVVQREHARPALRARAHELRCVYPCEALGGHEAREAHRHFVLLDPEHHTRPMTVTRCLTRPGTPTLSVRSSAHLLSLSHPPKCSRPLTPEPQGRRASTALAAPP